MDQFEKKLRDYISYNNVDGEHLIFQESCHSVEEAAKASNSSPEDFVKNICMVDQQGSLIVAIVKGEDKVSSKRVGKALNIKPPRIASPEEILEKTGFICGGVPSFGYEAAFLIDPRVMEKEIVYSGGGSQRALLKISTEELQRANRGQVVRIRK